MKRLTTIALLVLGSLARAVPLPLFDGTSLDGWEGDAKLWRVEDAMITGGSLTETVKHNDFLATKKSYANFDLRLKIKITGTGFVNSGVQIRSVRVPGNTEMSGYQVDAGVGWWGKLYDESRRNKVVAEPKDAPALAATVNPTDWNEYRIRTEGARIQSWINGIPALDYTELDGSIAQDGFIGIQVHGGGKTLVQVKDVTIEELPPTAGAPTWDKAGRPGEKKTAPKKDANASNSGPRTHEEERAALKVPEGYEVELVAAESDGVGKFVPLAFDQKGRLWTTTAFEYPVDGNENPPAADALYASKAKDKVLVFDTPFAKGSQAPRVFSSTANDRDF